MGVDMDVSKPRSHGAWKACHGIFYCQVKNQSGVSLIELLSTLVVVSILVSYSIPSLQQLLAANQLTGNINKLSSYLAYTRSEAIKQGQRITLCQSSSGQSCTGGNDWQLGWLLFIDSNNNKQFDSSEKLINSQAATSKGVKIIFNGSAGNDHFIYYKPDGSSYPNGTFSVCTSTEPKIKKTLIISLSGRVRISKQTAQGTAINC